MTKQLLIEKLSLISASNQALEIANDLEKDQDLISARNCIKAASAFWEKRLGDKYPSIQSFKNCKAISKILLVIWLHTVAKELAEESTKVEVNGDFTIYPNSWVNSNDLMYRYGSDVMAMRKRDNRGDDWQESTISNKELDQFLKHGVIFPCHWQIVENVPISDESVTIADSEGWIPEDPTNEDLEYIMGNSGAPEGEEISCNPDIAQLLSEGFNDLADLVKYSLSGMQSMSELIYAEYMKTALDQFSGGVVAEHHIYFTWLLLTDIDTKEDAIEAIHTGAITFQTIVEKYLNGEI